MGLVLTTGFNACTMNAPLLPERLLRSSADPQAELPLATAGVQRHVWDSRYGPMLIEVVGDEIFVNGQRVEPHTLAAGPRRSPGDGVA